MTARLARTWPWAAAVGPATALVVVLLVVPSGALLLLSVSPFDPLLGIQPGVTLENYAEVVRNPLYLEVLLHTLRVAALVTAGTLVLGYRSPTSWRARAGPSPSSAPPSWWRCSS